METNISLPEHERHSEHRAEHLADVIREECGGGDHHTQESNMSHEGMQDKVEVINKFAPGHGSGEGGMGGLGTAAVIAAMGNRNERDSTGLAAALPAMLMGRPHDGLGLGGFGAGLIGGVLGGALFGGRRGGLFGGGGDCDGGGGAETRIESDIFGTAVLSKLGSIEAAIPLGSAQTENVILQQTNALTGAFGGLALGVQQGFSNVKDSVQANSALNLSATSGVKDTVQNLALVLSQAICGVNQNISAQGCQTREAVVIDGDRTRALLQLRFSQEDQTRIQTLANEVIELRNEGRNRANHDELKLQITNTNTAVAAQAQGQLQAQQQAQFQAIGTALSQITGLLGNVIQVAHATNNNVIAGNTGAVTTGAQTASPTNVNA